jgi:hypothetical protein
LRIGCQYVYPFPGAAEWIAQLDPFVPSACRRSLRDGMIARYTQVAKITMIVGNVYDFFVDKLRFEAGADGERARFGYESVVTGA